MTVSQFKSHEANRQELSSVLQSTTFAAACAALLSEVAAKSYIPLDVPEIVSVRALAYRSGYEDFLRDLHAMIQPDRPPAQEPAASWGQDEAWQKLNEETQPNSL